MNAALDVSYVDDSATVACIRFHDWSDREPESVRISHLPVSSPYEPGMFYRRELPCLLHALKQESIQFSIIVIDGYVHLKPPIYKGLGLYLAESLGYDAMIIGVAKNPLKIADRYKNIYRGGSRRPLFISAAGMGLDGAADLIDSMHGEFRVPTLIKMADTLSRGHQPSIMDYHLYPLTDRRMRWQT